ncbi:malate dehydrogenase [Reticulomyxa filosa]|uniref:Malate dehydrogenase n=1 Tax=Reticulomyxa filosa TaxID=46433 RepID=X6MED7_RETFI|nr:malate dehydrogenase [Reticulomyxa filosa]|eukprot:ETO11380.1 malate dehydrogenase [Reticulomyxa filosa]
MERGDLLSVNAKIFEGQGQAIEAHADRNVKVCVVGNPANTNCLIAMQNAPSIPKENFTAMTRLDQNRAAERLKVPVADIKNVIIWGNHSSTQYPDINHGFVENFPSKHLRTTVKSAVNDDEWVKGVFLKKVQDRGAEIIQARGLSSAASAANACLDHVRDWILGTKPGEWVSMAVPSDGSYGVPRGLIYSFPVTCSAGNYRIVHGLPIDKFSREKMDATAKELLQEKELALGK